MFSFLSLVLPSSQHVGGSNALLFHAFLHQSTFYLKFNESTLEFIESLAKSILCIPKYWIMSILHLNGILHYSVLIQHSAYAQENNL